ncbi:pyruvate formate lyase family protein [Hungatella sp.]|uniref:pyruvate formate lyase family protein n=1 Tax=Hungatella sp. TaxID=2613924 RepID=UPI002A806E03|nr:pyruvate formate lyase family protein [Hungatella sp.]
MKIAKMTERITRLNTLYQNNEIHKNHWDYHREGRLRLLYNRAYIASHAPTTQLRKAEAEASMLRNMLPIVNDGELIVGLPDLSPLTDEENKEYEKLEIAMQGTQFIPTVGGHLSLDFPKLLDQGISGILDEIEICCATLDVTTPDHVTKEEFYTGCRIELEAILSLADTYAAYLAEQAEKAPTQRKSELLAISEILLHVPRFPARTFWEALESIHFFLFTLPNLFYLGRLDQYLYPYYMADLAAGRITPEKAQELLDCFLLIPAGYNGHSSSIGLTIGGRNRHGKLVENDVTKMVLTSCVHCCDCNNLVGYGISRDTSPEFLEFAIEIAQKTSEPVFFNDDAVTESFLLAGLPLEDARSWCNTGCVLTISGKCSGFGISSYHNMLVPLLKAMNKIPASFTDLKDQFFQALRLEVIQGVKKQNYIMLERGRLGHEVLRISALVEGCLKHGKSLDQGGGIYAFQQPNFIGFANVIDSLAVMKTLIYDTKKYTMKDFLSASRKNFEGYETLLEEIKHVPRFGTNDEATNQLAQCIAQMIAGACKGIKNYRGGAVLPGMFSYTWHAIYGSDFQATPDGRLYGQPFANGINPVSGAEVNGADASLCSETAWDQKLIPVSPSYSIVFTPAQKGGPDTRELVEFVRRYFNRGGSMIHLALATIEDMKAGLFDAEGKEFPVSIGAFSVTMSEMKRLSEHMQADMFQRNEHRTTKFE